MSHRKDAKEIRLHFWHHVTKKTGKMDQTWGEAIKTITYRLREGFSPAALKAAATEYGKSIKEDGFARGARSFYSSPDLIRELTDESSQQPSVIAQRYQMPEEKREEEPAINQEEIRRLISTWRNQLAGREAPMVDI